MKQNPIICACELCGKPQKKMNHVLMRIGMFTTQKLSVSVVENSK